MQNDNNNPRPKVSIGMPLYNAERYLAETLDSILGQTFQDFEVVISDNGSTDHTVEIVKDYMQKDKRIRFYQQEHNLGAAKNFNFVFEQSRGEYFRWNSYDDPIEPTHLEKTVAVLDRQPDAIMSYPKTILIDEDNQVIEYHDDEFNLDSDKAHQRLHKSFYSSAWCHPVFGLVRREVMARTGLIGSYASSDKVLLGEYALQGKCIEVPEHLANHRLHPEDSTSVNTTDEDMAAWFEPEARQKVTAPRWRRLVELSKGINRAPLNLAEKLQCYFTLGRFYINPGRARGALRDLQQIGRVLLRPFVKREKKA